MTVTWHVNRQAGTDLLPESLLLGGQCVDVVLQTTHVRDLVGLTTRTEGDGESQQLLAGAISAHCVDPADDQTFANVVFIGRLAHLRILRKGRAEPSAGDGICASKQKG